MKSENMPVAIVVLLAVLVLMMCAITVFIWVAS